MWLIMECAGTRRALGLLQGVGRTFPPLCHILKGHAAPLPPQQLPKGNPVLRKYRRCHQKRVKMKLLDTRAASRGRNSAPLGLRSFIFTDFCNNFGNLSGTYS